METPNPDPANDAAFKAGEPSNYMAVVNARLISWLAKYFALPLTPFIVGASIRMVRAGEWTADAFEPGELSFSMAMFCLFGSVAAQNLRDQRHREAIFVLFGFGVALFMSMFSFSIVESARLSSARIEALDEFAVVSAQGASPSLTDDQISSIGRESQIAESKRILLTIFLLVSGVSAFFITAAIVFRSRYGLGDE